MTVGIGVTTFARPEFLEKSGKALVKQCSDVVDRIVVYNDGSDPKFRGAYKRAYKAFESVGATIIDAPVNRGCAAAKNALIDQLLPDCDWIILAEDDIKPLSPLAVTEYVRICEETGNHHLSFAHHGPANVGVPLGEGDVSYFPHSVGAWAIFSRECLKEVGVFDEAFRNAWEHVEHELRLIEAGFMPGASAYSYPDVTRSAMYLQELPNAIEKSSIRPRSDWWDNIREGLIYWKSTKTTTYLELFGEGKPLFHYAQSIIGPED